MKNVAIVLALLVAGIAVMNGIDRDEKATPGPDLAGGWTLESMTVDGKTTTGLAKLGEKVTLFVDRGKISGWGGCNSYGAKAKFSDGAVSLGDLDITQKAGKDADMKREAVFTSLLVIMKRYEFEGKDLILSDGTNDSRLHFVKFVPPKMKPLIGTKWFFDGFEESKGDTVSLTAEVGKSKIYIEFGEDGKAAGSGGVNRYFGGYEADIGKGTVKFGGIGSTRKGGPPGLMKQEAKFFKQLKEMTRFEIVGDRLVLKDERDKNALLFKAGE